MIKKILALCVLLPAIGGMGYYFIYVYAPPLPFESVCQSGHQKYTRLCENVGRRAHNLSSLSGINKDVDYGPILGVAWRSKGSRISISGQERRISEKNAYYYIIGSDNSDYVFLRLADQTAAHGPRKKMRRTK